MVIRYHGRVWYYWWQRDCVVRYLPPSEMNINNCQEATEGGVIENSNSINTLEGTNVEIIAETSSVRGAVFSQQEETLENANSNENYVNADAAEDASVEIIAEASSTLVAVSSQQTANEDTNNSNDNVVNADAVNRINE